MTKCDILGLYRQPSRRHSFTDAKYYVTEDPVVGKRLSMIIPSSESTKVEEEQQQQPMMGGSCYTEEPQSMLNGPEERQPSPPPKKKSQPTPPTLEKPFDPSLSRPHHSPNTPDCLPSPVTPNQTKIPSPWGSMVSLVPDTPTTRQTTDSSMNSPTSSSSEQHGTTTTAIVAKPVEPTMTNLDTTTTPAAMEKDTNQPSSSSPSPEDILDPYKKPRFTCIASYSLTHNKDALRTYRRMATKTRSPQVQMAYAKYLLDVARLYVDGTTTTTLRQRILEEARYWISKLAKRLVPEALYIKGQWHFERRQTVKAIRYFEKAAKNGWMPAYIDLAEHADRQGDWHKAIAYYRSADGYADATYASI